MRLSRLMSPCSTLSVLAHLEDIHFATRSKVANSLAQVHLDVACRGVTVKLEGLDLAILSPVEGYGFAPVLTVGAI